MRIGSMLKNLAVLPAILLIGAGCGGIAASQTVSPLMFLLPGFGQNKAPAAPAPTQPKLEPVRVLAQSH